MYTHDARQYEHPLSAHLVLSGWGYAELPLYGVLGSSSSKDMRMGAEVQDEKAPPR
jgi:hypothetical protein